jgi:predicted enzyme related to lactoylglutathione lyase
MNPLEPDHVPTSPSATIVARSLEASLTVRDLAASVAWYAGVVGFAVEREYRRDERLFAVAIRAGAVEILLVRDDGAKGLDRAKGEGFSLQITTTRDIDDLAARIRARGGTLETEPSTVAGKRAFRLRDPDGFRFTISSPREA